MYLRREIPMGTLTEQWFDVTHYEMYNAKSFPVGPLLLFVCMYFNLIEKKFILHCRPQM